MSQTPKEHFLLRLAEIYFKHKSKAHVKISLACLAVAGACVSTPLLQLVFQALGWLPADKVPWWGIFAWAALFFFVGVGIFFYFHGREVFPPQFNVTINSGCDFYSAATTIAERAGRGIDFPGFSDDELAAPLRAQQLRARTVHGVLRQLRNLQPQRKIPAYEVIDVKDGPITLRKL